MSRAVDQPDTSTASSDVDAATQSLAQCNIDDIAVVDRPGVLRHTSSTSSTATVRGSALSEQARAAGSSPKLDSVNEVSEPKTASSSFSSAFQSRRKPQQASAAPTRPPSSWHRMPSFGTTYGRDIQHSPTSSTTSSTASTGGLGTNASTSYASAIRQDGPILYSPTMLQSRSAASDTAPVVPTIRNLRGKWKLLKSQSDDVTTALAVQGEPARMNRLISPSAHTPLSEGYGAPIRKAVGLAPVFLDISYQTVDINPVTPASDILRIKQHTTGGMMAITEEWCAA